MLIRFGRSLILLLAIGLTLCFASAADACPNCKHAMEMTRAFAFGASIILLMSMPFAIGSCWFFAIIRCSRTTNK